ncbi:uncharacterized protein LACBIDRAFT_324688 [Laccaria bicolor S238N-H82]|uniref:Predicted protein n=1 Tax=Laccaria bicolor (strain S238N-H82 / ATCC MYA-4686) TaxID=486041 RepID=B0D2Q4_LACBS|nr:uncharacterized protein LACBIDRAFT_324688 [Laccaria bicolor S238N-H82]EDR11135.1 predicted protein [Laccaria bicolor S238N-H82]|eukprot:XP_001878436.1 predicted protein [Laccaria bicolor S238N-H82]
MDIPGESLEKRPSVKAACNEHHVEAKPKKFFHLAKLKKFIADKKAKSAAEKKAEKTVEGKAKADKVTDAKSLKVSKTEASETAADRTVESSLPETSEKLHHRHHHYRPKAERNAARKAPRKSRKAKFAKEYGLTSEDDFLSSRIFDLKKGYVTFSKTMDCIVQNTISDTKDDFTGNTHLYGRFVYAFEAVRVWLCRNRGKVVELHHIYLRVATTMPQTLDYDHNTYLAVTLSTASHTRFQPSSLSAVHPSLTYHGQVGELHDVQLFAVPKADWDQVGEDILAVLKAKEGVLGVDVQVPKQRVKRGSDEL